MHVRRSTFCLYVLAGVEQWCVEAVDQLDGSDRRLSVDPESIAWSPDGRYIAFTTQAFVTLQDSDIWVLDVEEQQYTNLTQDSYDGRIGFGDDIPDGVFVDLAPAWMPDGTLTFARHTPIFNDGIPSLMAVDPAGGEPEKVTDFEFTVDALNLVMSMSWSPDGSRMAYVLDSSGNPFGGLWLYDVAEGDMRPLVIPPDRSEGHLRADFSPDGNSILLLTIARERSRGAGQNSLGNGYFVVSADTGSVEPLQSDFFIVSAGWLPGGGLIYAGVDPTNPTEGGVFVAASASDPGREVLDLPEIDDQPRLVFAPTPQQVAPIRVTAGGRLLLGTAMGVTLAVELR
jgi:dipeptidyl aminopeptidase/acylaminoacyl peptidase